jgi:hypothetical protein
MKIYRCKLDRSIHLLRQVTFDSYSLVFVGKKKIIASILRYLCLFVYGGVKHNIYTVLCFFVLFVFVLCFVYAISPVSLNCSFLIAPSVFSNVYLIRITITLFMASHNY